MTEAVFALLIDDARNRYRPAHAFLRLFAARQRPADARDLHLNRFRAAPQRLFRPDFFPDEIGLRRKPNLALRNLFAVYLNLFR